MDKYQLLPTLTEEEYSALKANINENGVIIAVEYDEEGNILDGHHRVKACTELGIKDWPKVVRPGMTEEEKRTYVRSMNLNRRHLSNEQKRELIKAQLMETPKKSNREIGRLISVDHKTVKALRELLEASGEIPQYEFLIGADGKVHPVKKERKVTINAEFQVQEEIEVMPVSDLKTGIKNDGLLIEVRNDDYCSAKSEELGNDRELTDDQIKEAAKKKRFKKYDSDDSGINFWYDFIHDIHNVSFSLRIMDTYYEYMENKDVKINSAYRDMLVSHLKIINEKTSILNTVLEKYIKGFEE